MITATLYFKLDYSFTQAMRLGVLSGFFIGIVVSFFTAIILHITRKWKQPEPNIHKQKKKRKKKKELSKRKKVSKEILDSSSIPKPFSFEKDVQTTHKQTIMLLMDYTLAFEVALHATEEEKTGRLTSNNAGEGHISLNTKDEHIFLSILSLTKHTTQVMIESDKNSVGTRKIIHYLKEKEFSFLQY